MEKGLFTLYANLARMIQNLNRVWLFLNKSLKLKICLSGKPRNTATKKFTVFH